jgi:hypothetical protein
VVAGAFLLAVLALITFDVRLNVVGSTRELSGETLRSSLFSIINDTDNLQYDATKAWRIAWWNKILDYTLYGDYFWFGKGFGVNLAHDDGIVPFATDPLRSPHNGHLTILARAGIPGFALWILLNGTWVVQMLLGYRSARKRGLHAWSRLFHFLIVYWGSFLVSASFDVFLEGPMAGIWFWSIFGAGIGAVTLYRRHLSNAITPAVGEPVR